MSTTCTICENMTPAERYDLDDEVSREGLDDVARARGVDRPAMVEHMGMCRGDPVARLHHVINELMPCVTAAIQGYQDGGTVDPETGAEDSGAQDAASLTRTLNSLVTQVEKLERDRGVVERIVEQVLNPLIDGYTTALISFARSYLTSVCVRLGIPEAQVKKLHELAKAAVGDQSRALEVSATEAAQRLRKILN